MNVAIIISNYYPYIGGAEIFAQEIAQRLVKDGHRVDVITGRWDRNLPQLEVINGVSVYRINLLKFKRLGSIAYPPPMLWKLLLLNRANHYDLIHSIGEIAACEVGTIGKKLMQRPHLMTLQGGYLTKGLRNRLTEIVVSGFVKWNLRNADVVHAISQKLAQNARRFGAKRVVVIPNGVNGSIFKSMDRKKLREQYGFSIDAKIVVSVARLVPVKGLDYLIKAVSLLLQTDNKINLLIIGDGSQRAELEELISELKLDNRVRLMGTIPHEQIAGFLNQADVFVLPSLSEGLGIAIIEAMACGIPVIGTNVDGIPDIIKDNDNGVLVPPGDAEALAGAIDKLLQNEELRGRLVVRGLEEVEQRFQWENIYQQVRQVYFDLTGSIRETSTN